MFEEFDFPQHQRRTPRKAVGGGRVILWLAACAWAAAMFGCIVLGLARVGSGPTMPDAAIAVLLLCALVGFGVALAVDRIAFAGKR